MYDVSSDGAGGYWLHGTTLGSPATWPAKCSDFHPSVDLSDLSRLVVWWDPDSGLLRAAAA